ncbi:hypothetical protein THRCLA_00674 [Thraustotheca clavata]|uniref:Tudor domain-containing protein n=1 Tax=Thraustotheca clavata TaxID=74557 RepID=A0A1W0AAX1_9STRA|nr:hypothetical protein THRCLA_00674 [Thraustotheca clavata]
MLLHIGSRVDGLYAGGGVWFPGYIVETGTLFTVKYDDGEVEENVPEHFLRVHELGTFSTGSRVLVRYGGGEEYYAGVITGIDEENQLYDIAYDDGEVEENVAVNEIVAPVDSEPTEALLEFKGIII